MAEAHKFKSVEDAREVFPDLVVQYNKAAGTVAVYNSKEDEYVVVDKGQYIVKIADRYEVHDDAPDNATHAEAPKAAKKSEAPKESPKKEAQNSEETPKAVKGNQTVVPEELGTPPGPESK